ncbi:autotransporter outer membrane beta-barrel domain-containing protein [uncultured Megasphaera sp.]|uniref:autotransporter outer membrane beta-barrel domain-containing protein n=1 Tax=uncultured Megasphaera sp. TaxID=165188 RepID=UPI0025E8E4F9|nr:autotransporter outer membrane beta-barrel domain-containing protein [uncultured Megasphaera sp.]
MACPSNRSSHYGSTWYEAGFGGTYRANDSTYLYADAERSFGSNWHKKWQINIGINWQF